MFTSFGYFPTDEEDAAVLAAAFRSLRPGGRLLIDTIAREKTMRDLVPEEIREKDGIRSHVRRTITADGLRVEKVTEIADGDGPKLRRESVRLYAPEELGEMFSRAGFVDVALYGSLGGELPSPDSPRLVVVGARPQEEG